MDINTLYDRRRIHLQRLIRERFKGNQTALAKAVERSAGEISRWLSPPRDGKSWTRNMSEISARRIENHLGLETGYLDRPLSDGAAQTVGEPIEPYDTTRDDSGRTPTSPSSTPGCCHGDTETQCRHCARIQYIMNMLPFMSLEEVETLSKVIDVLRAHK